MISVSLVSLLYVSVLKVFCTLILRFKILGNLIFLLLLALAGKPTPGKQM